MAEDSKPKKDRRPIVCGTDFSANAMEAVDIAAEIARGLDVKLLLLHVEESRWLAAADPTLMEQVASQNRQALSREIERVGKLGVTVEGNLLSGSIFNQLVDAALESDASLLIVGAVGHGVARRLLVGSVAERVAETSAIPTLVLRPESKLGSWLRGKHTLKVLAGYDFSPAGDAALRWLNGMQGLGACEVSVVHIDWPPEEGRRPGSGDSLPATENPKKAEAAVEHDLAKRVAKLLSAEKVITTVEPGWGHPEGHLFEIAHRKQADLVVVGTHRRHGLGRLRFGSVSRTVLHHATAAVAVVPLVEEGDRSETRSA